MAGKGRFDIPLAKGAALPRERRSGPMGVAGREVGESLTAATEAQVEARRRNAADAKAWREAQEDGRVLVRVPVDEIHLDDLPRDRLALDDVAASDEMEELKASMRARGQREPIEVFRDAQGHLQLKKGWRRLTALRALLAETGDPSFSHAVCRVDADPRGRVELYVDMVEENAVREDLSFAEMAQLAIEAQRDPACGFASHDDAVRRLYGNLQKMKRSNIRQFVVLMDAVGDALRWPKAVGRDLGANVGRKLRGRRDLVAGLRSELAAARTAEEQLEVLRRFVDHAEGVSGEGRAAQQSGRRPALRGSGHGAKVQFRQGGAKVVGKAGECRLSSDHDFSAIPQERLAAAVAAFYAKLSE